MSTRQNWKSFFSTQRHVNLIYFVDAAKTKTIRVSMRTASMVMIAAGLVAFWAMTSGILLIRLQAKQSDLRAELSASRSVIFEYQTLHDGVFEQAYPEIKDRRLAAAQSASAKPVATSPQAEKAEKVEKQADRKPGETQAATESADKSKIVSREDSKSPVSLSNPTVVRHDGSFEVFFDLRNADTANKAEGFIWGVAAMEKQSGERVSLTVPRSLVVSPSGDPVDAEHGQRFGIRRYARRSFVFTVPPRFEGRVLTVDIAFSGQGGKYRSSYTIPVNMRFNRLASNGSAAEVKPVRESAPAEADVHDASLDSP
jgi:hypothetical protein